MSVVADRTDDRTDDVNRAAERAEAATLTEILSRGRVRGALALLGPAFVASVAYVDPGNFATNFQAGAEHGYLLVWVVVMASLMAMLVQYLTSKLGLATGGACRNCAPNACRGVSTSSCGSRPR